MLVSELRSKWRAYVVLVSELRSKWRAYVVLVSELRSCVKVEVDVLGSRP